MCLFVCSFMHYLHICFYLLFKTLKLKTFFTYFTITIYHVSRKLTVGVRAMLDMFRLVVTLPSPISNSIIKIARCHSIIESRNN